MSKLTFLGTVHRDPNGMTRLVGSLDELKPDIITLELSVYGLRWRQNKRRVLRQMLSRRLREIRGAEHLIGRELKDLLRSVGIGGITALLDLPFEYKGAKLYSQRHSLPFLCLDVSSYSRQLLTGVDELLSPANLRKIIALETSPLQEAVTKQYLIAQKLLVSGHELPWRKLTPMDEQWKKRDQIIADKIRKVFARYPRGNVVHIAGWQHLLLRQGTLFSLLQDVRPRRVLLGGPYI